MLASFNELTSLFLVVLAVLPTAPEIGEITPSELTVADVVAACAVSEGANAPNTDTCCC
ncbi:hypothetical protein [Companilactobacillus kedongensis]|uniref:hypothetical protein n=1 Tax=Companilactobacillus kedongensis TaxID=2486004 RepID=UPI0013DD976D|nr:hypothetical protein [Companilactobacillus kedongensis]